MIKLEFYRDKIKDFLDENPKYINLLNERFGCKVDYGENYTDKFVDWLLEEYKEPIKLKQWEYYLLVIYARPNIEFKKHGLLMELSAKGYFKGIEDTSMKIKDILDTCEVVE